MKKLGIGFVLLLMVTLSGVAAQEEGEIERSPELFFGQSVTVEGVVRVISPNVFEITQTQPFDLTPASLLIFAGSDSQFDFDIADGMRVQVTGTFNPYNLANVESMLGTDFDDSALGSFSTDDYILTMGSIEVLAAGEGSAESRIREGNNVLMDAATAADLQANPQNYFDQSINVEGVASVISPNVFELTLTQPFDLAPAKLVIFPGTGSDFGFDIANGTRLRVAGIFNQYDLSNAEAAMGVDLDDETLGIYSADDYAITATAVTRLSGSSYADAATTLDVITDDPQSRIGQTVTVGGYVAANVDTQQGNFVLHDDDAFDQQQVLVLTVGDAEASVEGDTTENFSVDDYVIVTGNVRTFSVTDLEAELGYDLDDTLYANYQGMPVIVASTVEHAAEVDRISFWEAVGFNIGATSIVGTGTFDPADYADFPTSDASLDGVLDNPSDHYGQVVNIEGRVTNVDTAHGSFWVWDNDLIAADRALVIGGTPEFHDLLSTLSDKTTVTVRGVVRPYVLVDLQNEIGFDFGGDAFAGFKTTPSVVIVALEVTVR